MNTNTKQHELNVSALLDPQPGDYWHERFCPYFIVVHRVGDKIVVLSAIDTPEGVCAKVNVDKNSWTFDPSKSMTVDRQWIEKHVKYKSIDAFVADVCRSDTTMSVVEDYISYRAKELSREIQELGPMATKYILSN